MNSLRQILKQSIALPHQSLENLEIMTAYSSGSVSFAQYIFVTKQLCGFWLSHHPATNHLPPQFNQFYSAYVAALLADVGEPMSESVRIPVNEIAFFYVLLGSGLGAQVILRRNQSNVLHLPLSNIEHLAQHSGPLWKSFLAEHLSIVPQNQYDFVVDDAHALFSTLYQYMNDI